MSSTGGVVSLGLMPEISQKGVHIKLGGQFLIFVPATMAQAMALYLISNA